jgi:hypothetical protein
VTPGGVSCPGHAGGPGRPLNSRPRLITALREALDEDDTLERLRRVAIERMEAGDPAFWKMLLDRVWPARVELSAETESVVEFRWAGQEPTPQSQVLISRNVDQ